MEIVLDYGMGNTRAVVNMALRLGHELQIVDDPRVITKAKKIIIPGVGAFDHGMSELKRRGFIDVLNMKALEEKVPILGICLGLQLMTQKSDEGTLPGLGWIPTVTAGFDLAKMSAAEKCRVPHMGWNEVRIREHDGLFESFDTAPRFYFAHSFHLAYADNLNVLAESEYGYRFPVAVKCGNISGVQFHPEKSHGFGMKLLASFLRM